MRVLSAKEGPATCPDPHGRASRWLVPRAQRAQRLEKFGSLIFWDSVPEMLYEITRKTAERLEMSSANQTANHPS
jgi:hypothetical protein